MTCRYTQTHWGDALYNAVRAADGGVKAAAHFLDARRGVSIHPESLRRKLRGEDHLDVEMAVLLSEFVAKDAKAQGMSKDWLLALCAQEGLYVDDVPAVASNALACEAKILQDKTLAIAAKLGEIAGVAAQTTADNMIDQGEADQLIPLIRAARAILHRMEHGVLRAVGKGK